MRGISADGDVMGAIGDIDDIDDIGDMDDIDDSADHQSCQGLPEPVSSPCGAGGVDSTEADSAAGGSFVRERVEVRAERVAMRLSEVSKFLYRTVRPHRAGGALSPAAARGVKP
jgi:hypothetical protein